MSKCTHQHKATRLVSRGGKDYYHTACINCGVLFAITHADTFRSNPAIKEWIHDNKGAEGIG